MASDDRILVPVADSTTLRQTVEYAVDAALDTGSGYVRFVYVYPGEFRDRDSAAGTAASAGTDGATEVPGSALLERVTVWAEEDAGTHEGELRVDTATIGTEEYLFSPEDVAAALADDARRYGVGRVLLDPEYDPGIGSPLLRPLEAELARYEWLRVGEAAVQRRTRRGPLLARTSALQVGALFGLSFVFYQVLAGTLVPLDLVTGAISATVVAVGISRITLTRDPSLGTLTRLVRMVLYTPYLLYEILKANVAVAAVILHPRLPIDPRMTRVEAAVWGALPVTMLANSITLTPGTLSVRVQGRSLTVHTLIPAAREDLFDGGLERWVRFVFYGRQSMSIGSPRERGDTEVLQSPADGSEESDAGGRETAPDPADEGGDQP
jgi:multicomponent Na+:H+ antiporter subunit E